MPKIIVADTSCLIVLDQIGKLSILQGIYSEISITQRFKKNLMAYFQHEFK